MFFGTSSPIRKEKAVAIVIAKTTDKTLIPSDDNSKPVSQGLSIRVRAGSATNPVSKVVRVIPSWADERCVEVFATALIGRSNPFSPAA
jgi:hypothetical protein